MRKPFRTINASISGSQSGGISKLFVPVGVKKPNIAARFCSSDGTLTPAHLIAMAQSDKTSVEHATILDCDAIEDELLRYNHNSVKRRTLPLAVATCLIWLDTMV